MSKYAYTDDDLIVTYRMVGEGEGGNADDAAGGDAGVSNVDDEDDDLSASGEEGDGKGGERDAGDTGDADPAKAVIGLRKRLAKLTAQRNKGREAAQERDALRAKLDVYEKRERDARRALDEAQRRTPENQQRQKGRQAVVDTLDDALGEGTVAWMQNEKQAREAERERAKEEYGFRGIGYLATELEDHGIKADEKTLKRWERAVGSELEEDAELLGMYQRPGTQKRAVEEAVKRVREGIINPVLKQGGAKPLERVSRNREALLGNRGRGAVEGAPEPKFDLTPPEGLTGRKLDEWWATKRMQAWDQLNSQGE